MSHTYTSTIIWTGNTGQGTASYRGYDRTWDIAVPGKAPVHCSNDPMLGGDPRKLNPEDLLLSALSACHMLWYLHFAAEAGVVVTGYEDTPTGFGEVQSNGAGRFTRAILKPTATVVQGTDTALAASIHERIHDVCFIARSVNFPISYEPKFIVR